MRETAMNDKPQADIRHEASEGLPAPLGSGLTMEREPMTAVTERETSYTGMMHTLDRTGDTRVMWDKANADEVTAAKAQFASLTKKGYLAYKAEGKDGRKGEQIREFDADAERIILVKPLVGG